MTNPNKHRGSSIPNSVDILAVHTVNNVGEGDIRPGETPSQWIRRITEAP